MVFSEKRLEFEDTEADPLIGWSSLLLHVTDGIIRVRRHRNTAYIPGTIKPTVLYNRVSVLVWGCISHDDQIDLVTIQRKLPSIFARSSNW